MRLNIKVIEKYIIRQILVGLVAVVIILVGIAWLSQILRLIEYMVDKRLSVFSFIYFTSLLLPRLFVIVLPIAFFSVVLFVYNRMINDKELVVMQAVGMNIRQLARPVILFSVVLVLLSFFINLAVAPKFAVEFREYKWNIKNSMASLMVKEGAFNEVGKGFTIYVKEAKGNTLLDIFISDKREAKDPKTIMAKKGQIVETDKGITVVLVKGNIQEKGDSGYGFGSFNTYTIDLGMAEEKDRLRRKPEELGLVELLYPEELGYVDAEDLNKYKMEFHRRIITPFYNVIFALIALIGVLRSSLNRRQKSKFVLVAILLMVGIQSLYISLFSFLIRNIYLVPGLYVLTAFLIIFGFYVLYSDKFAERVLNVFKGKKQD